MGNKKWVKFTDEEENLIVNALRKELKFQQMRLEETINYFTKIQTNHRVKAGNGFGESEHLFYQLFGIDENHKDEHSTVAHLWKKLKPHATR